MKRYVVASLLSLSLFIGASSPAAIHTFVVSLDGHQEVNSSGVPDQGDLDGTGTATLTIDDVALSIEWNIVVQNILLPPSGAHIHQAPAGVNGPIVVDFDGLLSGSGEIDADLANVLANPAGFYVNIHNTDFAAGAIRGQIPEPTTVAMVGLALLAGATMLRRR